MKPRGIHSPRHELIAVLFGALALFALAFAGCSDDGPNSPPVQETPRLAGGGRAASDDPLTGGREDSGPDLPDGSRPDIAPYPGYIPVFYSDLNCFPTPFEKVITNQADWQAWWTTAVSCLPVWDPPIDPPPPDPDPRDSTDDGSDDDDADSTYGEPGDDGWGEGRGGADGVVSGDSIPSDSGVVDPGYPWNPYGDVAPEVDFNEHVVVVIGLEKESVWGRYITVREVVTEGGETKVRYDVSKPGDDCLDVFADILMRPGPVVTTESSPTTAVLVPRPADGAAVFERSDLVWNCTWEPDPKDPLSLYYTDAECDLGIGEQIITDAQAWDTWTSTAIACDMGRWGDPTDPPKPTNPDGSVEPGVDPSLPIEPFSPTHWIGVEVDFTTHAVIILRGVTQTRWGGGIWLNAFESSESGTEIDYSVMEPSDECPLIDGGNTLVPTVAIRVPLPLASPVRFERHEETIDCRWDWDDGGEPRPLDGDVNTTPGDALPPGDVGR